jgi:amino acid transporter
MIEPTPLRRTIGTTLLVLYGVGTIVGAGIYALVGEVAASAGRLAPVSFLIAALMAAGSALSFAELSSRHPLSAGEAEYVAAAFGSRFFSAVIGLSVISIGAVSAATVVDGFAGYAGEVIPLSAPMLVLGFVALIAALAAWGIEESLLVTGAITIVEVGGLLLVIAYATAMPDAAAATGAPTIPDTLGGVMAGALLAFFAFVGFEDMVNVAEEVREAPRTMPRAIVVALVTTTLLYLALSYTALRVVPADELGASTAPLRLVYERAGGPQPRIMNGIAILAMLNGALVQVIMAARVAYGLAQRHALPAWIGVVAARTQTPVRATLVVAAAVATLALRFPIATLARTSSLITLAVFAAVNLSLIVLKRRTYAARPAFEVPAAIPWCGLLISLAALVYGIGTRL